MRPSLLFLLVISVSAVKADEVTDVQVLLPESETWNQITSDESAAGYTREWVPDGRTGCVPRPRPLQAYCVFPKTPTVQ